MSEAMPAVPIETPADNGQPAKKPELSVVKSTNQELLSEKWGPKYLPTGEGRDQFGEADDVSIRYELGEWHMNGKRVSFKTIKDTVSELSLNVLRKQDPAFDRLARKAKSEEE